MRSIQRYPALSAYISCFIVALLVCTSVASVRTANHNKPGIGSRPTAQKNKRMNLTPAARLRTALEKSSGQNAVIPVVMHTMERGLKGPARQGKSQIDAIFDQVLKRHPGVSKALLQKFVTDWNAIPATIRERISPLTLRKLDPAQPLQQQMLKVTFRESVNMKLSRPSMTLDRSWAKAQQNTVDKFNQVTWVSPEPVVSKIDPSSSPSGYSPGQTVAIHGFNFSKEKTNNTIVIYKKLGNSKAEWKRLTPTLATGLTMEAKLPNDIAPGQHFIKIEVKKATGKVEVTKKFTDLLIKTPPPPAPKITSISPANSKPGQEIVIAGNNFNYAEAYVYAYFVPLEGQPLEPYNSVGEINGEKAGWSFGYPIGSGQVKFKIPDTLFAGKYRVAIHNAGNGASNWVDYTVSPHRYKVNFTQIMCKDESDPEAWGGDEIVAAWMVVGDTSAWNKLSTEYEDFDDNTVKAFNGTDQSVFMVDGSQGDVKQVLAISTLLFEWDSGDVASANQAVGFVGDLASKILAYIYGPQAGAAVEEIVPFIQQLVSWLGGNPDLLGRRDLYFSARDLLIITAQSGKKSGTLHFDNSDGTGSYALTYDIYRE